MSDEESGVLAVSPQSRASLLVTIALNFRDITVTVH